MELGAPITVAMTKWGDRPHWRFPAVFLGRDEWGTWLGAPAGTHNTRPGLEFHSEVATVSLVPDDDWYVAAFNAPGIAARTYIDISSPATWHGSTVTAVDLDLDVIRLAASFDGLRTRPRAELSEGHIFIDDEDEFLEHQVLYGYPADVIASARTSADALLAAVSAGAAPFGGQDQRWHQVLDDWSASQP